MKSLTAWPCFSDTASFEYVSRWMPLTHFVNYHADSDGLDFHSTEEALRQAALDQGINLDQLLEAAGAHFPLDVITPSQRPTGTALEALVADELRASFDDLSGMER
jgi:hypothetical protein